MPLSSAERFLFEQSLHHSFLFRHVVRRELYRRNGGDPEKVHEYVLDFMSNPDVLAVLEKNKALFDQPELRVTLNGITFRPFGTAAGVDKNGDALEAFSYIYGFQEMGTVVIPKREGNARPRVAADGKNEDLYNAQGFPSHGMEYAYQRLAAFRKKNATYPIFLNICGLPLSETNAVDTALRETDTLAAWFALLVQGFVWNPFSPNTEALKMLRTPDIFAAHAGVIKKRAPDKILLVKMGPYEDDADARKAHLDLTQGFLDGGGHGIVGPNTYAVSKKQVPAKEWGYEKAGRSGRFLRPYRERMVRDTHAEFPKATIFATGGIFDGDDAYQMFRLGATALESYTPETYYGPGLIAQKQRHVVSLLR